MDDLQISNAKGAIALNSHEKKLLLLKYFKAAIDAYEACKSNDFNNLDCHARYVLVAQSYNNANKTYGSGDPDILIMPISEAVDFYEHDDEIQYPSTDQEQKTAIIFDLNPMNSAVNILEEKSLINKAVY